MPPRVAVRGSELSRWQLTWRNQKGVNPTLYIKITDIIAKISKIYCVNL
ncbi:unnamed protein product [Brassica napus]|uniref:(rape) hypothetical protein n=1 Tax=Brassica napus TaxID=3708 RepID=A0A817B0B0_BRANA|nr:unnamed protein product [Brassica napus]